MQESVRSKTWSGASGFFPAEHVAYQWGKEINLLSQHPRISKPQRSCQGSERPGTQVFKLEGRRKLLAPCPASDLDGENGLLR